MRSNGATFVLLGWPVLSGSKSLRGDAELRIIAEGAPEPLILMDMEGRIVRAAGSSSVVFGHSPEALRGTFASGLLTLESRADFDQLVRTVASRGGDGTADLRALRSDGTNFVAGVRVHRVEFRGVSYLVADFRDISARMALQEALTERAAEYARASRDLQQFAYAVSHDLQEPLRMVASYTQLLSSRYTNTLDKDADEFLAFAHDGAVRMGRLIDDLLAFSRIDARVAAYEKVDTEVPFAGAVANLRVAIQEAAANVTHEPLPTLEADPSQLLQLFQNLIGNAIKFRGKEPPMIHVRAEKDGRMWKFSIRDNGIGIAPEYHEKVFVIFQRLHLRSEYPGNGIGLAVCRRIVERHGGKMWVESRGVPGEGSTFWFTLPDAQVSRRGPAALLPASAVKTQASRTAEGLIARRLEELV